MMRKNLIGEMAKARIKINDIATLLDINRNSVHNKLFGNGDFTFKQALLIADKYFPDTDLRWLFATSE